LNDDNQINRHRKFPNWGRILNFGIWFDKTLINAKIQDTTPMVLINAKIQDTTPMVPVDGLRLVMY